MLNFMHANATYIPTYIHAYITQHTPYQGFSVTGYIRAGTGVKQTEKTVSLQMAHTSLMICPLTYVPNPPRQLSLWEETAAPGENPRLSAERRLLLFSYEDWVRVALRNSRYPGILPKDTLPKDIHSFRGNRIHQ
jgi:hypothetical protein